MKRFLTLLATLSLSASAPALADPEIEEWKTPHSMGCMLLRECTDKVYQIKNIDDVKSLYPATNYSSVSRELESLVVELNRVGVEVFIGDGKYFPVRHRGAYDTKNNRFFLNLDYMYDPQSILMVTRHEGWHAAQDCMAGSLDNPQIAIIWQDGVVPRSYTLRANIAYANIPHAVPWEAEAMWAGETPYQTVNALKACKVDTPMWETYEPTPMTRKWLIQKGYIK